MPSEQLTDFLLAGIALAKGDEWLLLDVSSLIKLDA